MDGSGIAEATEGAVTGNLPTPLTRLIDRQADLSKLSSLVWHTRLLTLSGPGGAGKTRLALALAENVRADFLGGAWFVDLSSTVDSQSVAQVVASTLMPGAPTADPTPYEIARCFADASLLVLDNCDQVVEGCAELVLHLLARSQGLRVIATSRQPLGVPGEQVFRVSGLLVGNEPAGADGGHASPGSAVDLFIERAREASSSFDTDAPGVREAIGQICRWLDGMPLAIELAAARVPVLGVTQIAERLEHDTSFLRHSSRTAPARHRTLQNTLEWSHRMLEPAEQCLFRRLSVFRGGFSLAAAEAVCGDEILPAATVLDLLGVLIDRSLVQVLEQRGEPRYGLLATVRQYAAGKLIDSLETEGVRGRHAGYYYDRAEVAHRGLQSGDEVRWLERLELDHENLIDALEWHVAHAPQRAAELASMMWPFWYQRGYYREARSWFETALEGEAELPLETRADVLINAGEVAFLQCDYEIASAYLQRALKLEPQDQRAVATAKQRLGSIAREQADYERARELHLGSLAIWEQLGDLRGVAASRNYLGFVAWLSGDPDEAEELCSAALAEFERTGNLQETAVTLVSLGAAAMYRDDLELAADRLGQALSIARKLGFQEGIAWSLHELAIASRRRRQPVREQAMMLRDALLVHRQLGDRWRVASVLDELAGSLLARQDSRLAVQTFATVDALRLALKAPVPPAEAPDRDAALARLQRKLSPAAFASAAAEGRARDLDQAIELVVHAVESLAGSGGDESDRTSAPILTPRELAVLELLSEGHTNREIAAALYISPSTAGVHISNILRKLGAKRRVDAAGLAHAMGLLSTS